MTDPEDPADAADEADRSGDGDDETDEIEVAAFYDVLEDCGRPVVTASEVARTLGRSQAAASDALDALVDGGHVERLDVEADPVVWYPTDWKETADRERVVVFPERREIVVDRPTQFTRAQLSQFARLLDTNREAGYRYEVREEDIWRAPHESLADLLRTVRQAIRRREPALEEFVKDQWERAHRFRLYTHEEGYVVLEATSADLMGNVAEQKLDDGTLRARISDTEAWVAEEATAAVKRVLYEAGYPVQDERKLESGDDLPVDLHPDLRGYQTDWVRRFLNAGSGVLVGPPGSGKTVAAMGVMAGIEGETLILVPSRELARQWREQLLANTTLTAEQVGEYHGGRKQIRPVTIATYQTAGMDRHRLLFDERRWGLIVYDEVHHVPSPVARRSADLQTRHRLGLSVDGDTVVPIRMDQTIKMLRIEDFASDYLGEDVDTAHIDGVETLAMSDDGKVKWTDVLSVMRHRHGDPMYTVRTTNCREITVTEDHSLMVFDGQKLEIQTKTPRQLSENDYLLQPASWSDNLPKHQEIDILELLDEGYVLLDDETPDEALDPLYEKNIGGNKDRNNWKSRKNLPVKVARDLDINYNHIKGVYVGNSDNYIPPTVPIEDLSRIIGLFVADGTIDEHRVEFYATDTDRKSEVQEFTQVIRRLYPDAQINTIENGESCTTIRIGGPLVHIFENLEFSDGARKKSIPSFVLSNPLAYEPFIEGVMLGNGHIQERSWNKRIATISTSSDVFVQGLNLVLSRLGYVGGTNCHDTTIDIRDGERDIDTDNLVRFNPINRHKQPRNTMGPFIPPLGSAYEDIDCIPPTDQGNAAIEPVLTSGKNHRTQPSNDDIELLGDRADIRDVEWLADADIALLDVDTITEVEQQEYVYDISTKEETFLGNHIFCHNSSTPVREDEKQEEIYTLVGPPIGTDWEALFDAGYVAEPEVEIRYIPWISETHRNEYTSATGHERRQLAATNPAKVEEIRAILRDHPGQKTLIFVEYIDQGDRLAEELAVPFVSGETPHARRRKLFREFRSGPREVLIVSRVGDEGIDMPTAEVAIAASGLGGSRRQGAQRAGRTMRPVGKARMYVLATRGTREEEFARRRMRHLAEKGVRVREGDAAAWTDGPNEADGADREGGPEG